MANQNPFKQMIGQQQQVQVPEIIYVTFNAEINPNSSEGLLAVMANCATQKVKKVYLAISTPGGDVTQGMTLYNVLRGMPFELITTMLGMWILLVMRYFWLVP
jgi:ATP-dependent protease ClpP protease subunit